MTLCLGVIHERASYLFVSGLLFGALEAFAAMTAPRAPIYEMRAD